MSESNHVNTCIFVSYSHADAQWLERLKVHLSPLSHTHQVDMWDDTRIRPGSRWKQEIQSAVEGCDAAIVIISADYLASDFVRTNELPPLLKAAQEEGVVVLPIIASPSLFRHNTELSVFQAVNDPSAPLIAASRYEQEAVFVKVAETLQKLARSRRSESDISQVLETSGPENFLEHSAWNRLVRLGDWIFDEDGRHIIGSGMYAYLVSRQSYGRSPFVINASIAFNSFKPVEAGAGNGMNAGILFGWNHDAENPRYYNMLLTSEEVLLERIGFNGGEAYRDYEHLTERKRLKIERGNVYNFALRVGSVVDIFLDDKMLLSFEKPTGVEGRVGLRPWRSNLTCTRFVVSVMPPPVEQPAAADAATRRS